MSWTSIRTTSLTKSLFHSLMAERVSFEGYHGISPWMLDGVGGNCHSSNHDERWIALEMANKTLLCKFQTERQLVANFRYIILNFFTCFSDISPITFKTRANDSSLLNPVYKSSININIWNWYFRNSCVNELIICDHSIWGLVTFFILPKAIHIAIWAVNRCCVAC
jgi:hypothetical protein